MLFNSVPHYPTLKFTRCLDNIELKTPSLKECLNPILLDVWEEIMHRTFKYLGGKDGQYAIVKNAREEGMDNVGIEIINTTLNLQAQFAFKINTTR